MESFVRHIVVGGLAMVAGLWLAIGLESPEAARVGGSLLAAVGGGFLLYGIAVPLRY